MLLQDALPHSQNASWLALDWMLPLSADVLYLMLTEKASSSGLQT